MNLEDVSAERGILSCICQYGKDAYLDVLDIVQPSHFVSPTNQALASVLYYILEKDVDCKIDLHKVYSAAAELGLQGQVSEKDNQYVSRIMSFKTELSNVRDFAKKVRTLAETRRGIGVLSDTAEVLKKNKGSETLSEVIGKLENPIFDFINSLTANNQQVRHVGDGLEEYVEDLINNPKQFIGVPIGMPRYEQAVGGIETGVHVIVARPKVGKSSIGINAALHTADKPKFPVLFLDTEMRLENGQWNRMLARISGVEFQKIRMGRLDEVEQRKVRIAARRLKSLPIDYINISGRDFAEVISIVRRWLVQKVGYNKQGKINKCLIVYDYIKITDYGALKDMREYELIGMRLSHLHDLSEQYAVPILTFTQLNQEFNVSQSDRIRWYCTSLSFFLRKSPEEIAEDGAERGNRKLETKDCRFGESLDDGNYINYNLDGRRTTVIELLTRNELAELNNAEEVHA